MKIRLLGALALLLALLSFAGWRLGTEGMQVRAQAQIPRLWLGTSRQFGASSYKGSPHALGAMVARPVPLSMASTDLNGDGIDDLAIGMGTPGGGLVAVHRGDVNAFAPQSDASFWAIARGEFPSPYLPDAEVVELPIRPDFLASGDFIGLGSSSLAAASRGGHSIHVLANGDSGKLEVQQTIDTPGPITGLASDNRKSGKYWQLAVGVRTSTGPQLLVYTGSFEGLTQTDAIPLPGNATAIVSGNLDGDNVPDLLIVAGGQPAVLHGRSHRLESVSVPYTVTAAAVGNFVFDRDPLFQIALISSDGSVHILARDGLNNTPWTLSEMHVSRLRAAVAKRTKAAPRPVAERAVEWEEIESYPGLGVSGPNGRQPVMFRMRISSSGADDLAFVGPSRISVLTHPDNSSTMGMILDGGDLAADTAAALPVRVNIDARPGIVYVGRGDTEPYVMMPLPDPTFTVNTTADLVSANAHACLNNVAGQCSLRQAVIEANATTGTDTIMVPAGTYTLSIARAANPTYDARTGTLDVTDSVNIVGAGQNTTIIQGGTLGVNDPNGPNGVDKVFSFNQDITAFTNASVQVSNLTIQNGFNRGNENLTDGWGGAFDFDTGTNGTATLQLTNVTITNNTLTQGEGGGFAIFNSVGGSGGVTATNCVISNNVIHPDNSTAGGNGGGIAVEGSGNLVLIGSQVTGNHSNAASGGLPSGGGIYFVGGEFNLNSVFVNGSVTLQGVTVANNVAAGEGGGIFDGGGMTIEASGATLSSISNNQSGGDGGGIMSDAGGQMQPEALTISNATIANNSTTGAAGTGDGLGGGIKINQSGNFNGLTMTYNRLAGNTCTVGGGGVSNPGTNLAVQDATVNVAHNWWGTNTPLNTIDSYSGSVVNYLPYLQLTVAANPTSVTENTSNTSTVTASFLTDSGNNSVSAGNLGVLTGAGISFAGTKGSISGAQTTIQSSGTATATFSGTHVGTGSAQATVDSQTVSANIVVNSTTSTTANNATSTFSESAQNVTLTANVTAATGDTVNGGTVTFTIFNGGNQQVGTGAASNTVTGGVATATYSLPAGTPAGTYSVHANYSGTSTGIGDFLSSSETTHTLTVNPAPTTTMAANQMATFSASSQTVTLSAAVTSPAGTVNEGTITFTVLNGATPVGAPTTSATVSGGNASIGYTLPAATGIGSYTINATYNGDSNFNSSSDSSHTLSISAATTTTAAGATATFNSASGPVTLAATVTSAAGTVNSGTVTFSVFSGPTQIGSSTSPANVTNGSASSTYTLPGGVSAGSYTIQASYTGAGGFNSSSDNTHILTVNAASTSTTTQNATVAFSASAQSVTLAATVTSSGGTVNTGTVTFTVLNGATPIGTPTTSATVSGGNASVNYTVPAGTAIGTYTILAAYNGSTNFASSVDSTHSLTITGSATVTTGANAVVSFSPSSQIVTLSATVASGFGTVNAGTVTFTVLKGATPVGSPATSGMVANGIASANYTLPGGTPAGTYTIMAAYSGGGGFANSSDSTHILTVGRVTPLITWNNPANIVFGSALGSGQLNATANVPGTFVYTPAAGTVLPAGNGQTISTQFTPADAVDYNSAVASVQINVLPAGTATLVLTETLARDPNTGNVIVTATIANTGTATATGVTLTTAKIGTIATTTPLPISVPDVPAGGSSSVVLTFPSAVGTSGTRAVLAITGSYSGGAFGGSTRVVLP